MLLKPLGLSSLSGTPPCNHRLWEAIDALRSVGNIGAHMKQDVNVVVSVDPGEAELLIEFIEGLFKDWYVTKHEKEERNSRLKEMAEQKGEKPRKSKSEDQPDIAN